MNLNVICIKGLHLEIYIPSGTSISTAEETVVKRTLPIFKKMYYGRRHLISLFYAHRKFKNV